MPLSGQSDASINRADQDGVEIPCQGGEAVRWNRNFVGEITVGSPVERRQFNCSTGGLHDSYGLRNHFFSDPVTGNHGNTLHSYCTHVGNVSTAVKHSETRCFKQ